MVKIWSELPVARSEEQVADVATLVWGGEGGDHDAFAGLVDVHLARLDAAARLIRRDPELARDAVQ